MGRHEAAVVGNFTRAAVIRVGVSGHTIVSVTVLVLCCYAEETGRSAERIGFWGSHWDARRDVAEERGHEGGVGWVFEECFVGGTCVGVLVGVVYRGILDYRLEGGIEVLKEVDDEGGIAPAVNHTVSTRHHHVVVGYAPSESALSGSWGAEQTCSCLFFQMVRHLLKLASRK